MIQYVLYYQLYIYLYSTINSSMQQNHNHHFTQPILRKILRTSRTCTIQQPFSIIAKRLENRTTNQLMLHTSNCMDRGEFELAGVEMFYIGMSLFFCFDSVINYMDRYTDNFTMYTQATQDIEHQQTANKLVVYHKRPKKTIKPTSQSTIHVCY